MDWKEVLEVYIYIYSAKTTRTIKWYLGNLITRVKV